MDHLDTSWCPTCDRQILPKRTEVPILAPAPPSPLAPAPATPATPPAKPQPTRTKVTNAGRPRGLVHGTGRVKPNGTIKRTHAKKSSKSSPVPADTTPPPSPLPVAAVPASKVKTRTVIDQDPTPLYCSDACRLYDLHQLSSGLPHDFNPDRQRSPVDVSVVPRSPSLALEDTASSASDSDSSASAHSVFTHANALSYEDMDPSVATLAKIYGFPELGPAPPLLPENQPKPRVVSLNEYNGGIIMAGRRMKEILRPEPPAKKRFSSPTAKYTTSVVKRDRKPIPGWTDGSDAWRAGMYSMAAPKDWTVHDPTNPDNKARAYKTCVATPHRSTAGVYSTLGDDTARAEDEFAATVGSAAPSSLPSQRMQQLYDTYPLMNSRRADARSRFAPSSCPDSAPVRQYRECNILAPQAQGKLLVPDVKIRRSISSASVSSAGSSGMRSPRSLARRMSAMSEDTISEEGETTFKSSYPHPPPPSNGLPRAPTRQKTADELLTYTLPQLMVRQKRVEKRIVNGAEVDVEFEVEVPKDVKRLFLGPDGVNEHWARHVAAQEAAARQVSHRK